MAPAPTPTQGTPTQGTPTQRMSGFMAHLRLNGFAVGPAETQAALSLLATLGPADVTAARLGLKTLLAGDHEQWDRFDALFESYWLGRGVKTAARAPQGLSSTRTQRRPDVWNAVLPPEHDADPQGPLGTADGAGDDDGATGTGRMVGSRQEVLARTDLRQLVTPEDMAEAERLAERLATAIRYRLSRRREPSRRGSAIDMRRTIRRCVAHGGEPFDLVMRQRPDRPVRLVVLLDVSGSMKIYSRVFLAFVRGLLGAWLRADAFLFHTRLVRITHALQEADPQRAMTRLSLMAEGFGGGTRIADSIATFNDRYARAVLDSRSVVVIMSDGYDTDPPEDLAAALARLRMRARRVVWLNPLLGWKDYAPVARGMAAALPFVDCFAAANTLDGLAALEPELARL